MKIPYIARVLIVILIALALAEVSPEFVNAILTLVLIGVLLSNYKKFSGLFSSFGGRN
jgi:hypothetical protein